MRASFSSHRMDTHSALTHNDTTDEHVVGTVSAPQKKENFLLEMVRFAIIAVLIVFPIRLFIAQPFIVAGASMEPTFTNGQYLIVDELTYRFGEPHRGDVIIFRYPRDPSKFFIKRIIGLPGEIVHIEGKAITIFNPAHKDGIVLTEPYVARMDKDMPITQQLNNDEYFVLGDNRDASSDSRVWGILKRDLIVGRAFLRLLPLTSITVFPGRAPDEQGT
jgi:signal peptidase I